MRTAARVLVLAATAAVLVSVALAAPARKARRAAAAAPAKAEGGKVLVRIGKEAITEADLQKRIEDIPEQFRAQYSTPDGKKQVLERLVEERVWLKAAQEAGVEQREEVRKQLERQRRDLVLRTYVNELMAGMPAVGDSEIAAYYAEHRDDYRVPANATVSHLQTKTQVDGKRLKQWLARGQKWETLVQRYSADTTTRRNGGRLGTVTHEGFFPVLGQQPALAESVFALGVGQVGGPWQTQGGWQLIRVESVVQDSLRPLEVVRPMIQRQLSAKRQQDFYKAKLDEVRARYGVVEDSTAIRQLLSARKSARELFEDAQKAGAPQARIDSYLKVLQEYPDSDVSPQAQFMVGFVYSEELKNYEQAEAAFRKLLERYPKSELAASARWMIEHMRTEEAPDFMNLEADTTQKAPAAKVPGGKSGGR
jgi:peptidyl-prolyl cis-trans isomerase C